MRLFLRKTLGGLIKPFAEAGRPPPRTLGAFFRWCLAGAWPVLWIAAAVSALAGFLEVIRAFLLGAVIDAALAAGPTSFFADQWLLLTGLALYFIVLMPLVFAASAAFQGIVVPPNIYPLVQSRLHRWALGHDVAFFDNDFAGRIAQKEMQTARAVTDVVGEVVNVGAFALASLVGSALMLLFIDGWMALGLALWALAYLGMIRWFMPRIRKRAKARAGARAMVTGQVVDTVTNIKTVKLFGHQDHEDTAALDAMSTLRERTLDFGVLSTGFRLALMTLAGILPVVLVGGSLYLWQGGGATLGDVTAAGTVSIRLAQMTGWVSFTLMAVYANMGEAEDGMNTLTPPHGLTDAANAGTLEVTEGAIRFENVRFTYGKESGGGLEEVSLAIAPGEKLGLVGASGAGKTTLVSLLLRLYDTEMGAVKIDGRDIRTVTQDSLRHQIGMVTQETAMFNRTARDNILYGRPEASEAEMIAAARRAEAHDFITGLQDHKGRRGYDAFLGERGVKLSGGQRQRIALARAMLKDAPILVLDEATSALDSEVEAAIQQALTRAMEGKTVIAIAHRLSTIARMDRIVVLEEGRIVEEGGHDALLDRGGLYARFWQRQSGGFLGTRQAAE